jgi:hypothetical protein
MKSMNRFWLLHAERGKIMSPKNEQSLSAYFAGIIDICEGEDRQLLYQTVANGKPIFTETVCIDGIESIPPDRVEMPDTIPRAWKVSEYMEQDDKTLYDDVLTYMKRSSALDDLQWSVVAHFIFLTYLHDHRDIRYCPIILFYAVPGRGKSRTGTSIIHLAFRGIHLNEFRQANILRYSDNLHATLFFDIMDIWKKAERNDSQDILLGRFEKGQKCSRVLHPEKGRFRDTVHYEVYGPTIIATNAMPHHILDTRCLPIVMPNRPGIYENLRPEQALELKERLTACRAKHLSGLLTEIEPIDGITGRLWDISKPLFQVGLLVNPQGFGQLREAILAIAGEQSESKKETMEGHLAKVIRELSVVEESKDLPEWSIKHSEIVNLFNKNRPIEKQVSSGSVGMRLRSMSIRHKQVDGRSHIILTKEEYWTLLNEYGIFTRNIILKEPPTNSLPGNNSLLQNVMGLVGTGRDSSGTREEGDKCPKLSDHDETDNEEYEERAAIMEYDVGLSREEAERQALESYLKEKEDDDDIPF